MDQRFCSNLKNLRKQCGYTQKEIEEMRQIMESCYANWKQGRMEPNISTLRALGQIFEVSLDELING